MDGPRLAISHLAGAWEEIRVKSETDCFQLEFVFSVKNYQNPAKLRNPVGLTLFSVSGPTKEAIQDRHNPTSIQISRLKYFNASRVYQWTEQKYFTWSVTYSYNFLCFERFAEQKYFTWSVTYSYKFLCFERIRWTEIFHVIGYI